MPGRKPDGSEVSPQGADAPNWRGTLNLPQTGFPMKADLPRREPLLQKRWAEMGLYGQIRAARRGAPRFLLHDGPPYVNGHIHMGTALGKSLKDFIVRFHTLIGEDAPYVPGWDTHGLPVELQALRQSGLDRACVPDLELRRHCRSFALSFLETMTSEFMRLGVLGDWDHPYITLDPAYEAEEIAVFGRMAAAGLIYRGLRPVYWCGHCVTALAEAEVGFETVEGTALTVRFPVRDGKGRLPAGTAAVIWTTTPWTLPANVAIAAHPQLAYVVVETASGPLLCAESRAAATAAQGGERSEPRVLARLQGSELEGVVCRHPFLERDSPIVLADYVTATEGTGLVHTAPGHGREDFETGRRYGLEVIQPLDDHCRFTQAGGPLAGLDVAAANERVQALLFERGLLWHAGPVRHEYAHCWRCHQPVLWRATEQWFCDLDAVRDRAVASAREVRWHPRWGEERMVEMLRGRGDWCLSRQRRWGVPVPVLHCLDCGRPLLVQPVFDRIEAVVRAEGSDAWWARPAEDFLPEGVGCPACGGRSVRKDADILDVWFDSGCSHQAVLAADPHLGWPADLYLEGPDQYRGWFQSSLLTATATRGQAPYRGVVTSGWVLDGEGRAMHKSLGNVISPEELLSEWGVDVLRLWVASVDYTADVRISRPIMAQVAEVYRKIRNTLRFLLGNLSDYAPAGDLPSDLPDRDLWVLWRLDELLTRCREAYLEYRFNTVYHLVQSFCVQDLSGFYLDVAKDRLYCTPAASSQRRASQAAMEAVARGLLAVIAPILPHTADEAFSFLPRRPGDPESVHLSLWPRPPAVLDAWVGAGGPGRWAAVAGLREAVARVAEQEIAAGRIGKTAEAAVWARLGASDLEALGPLAEELADLLLVARVELDPEPASGEPEVSVVPTPWPRCPRCWRYRPTAQADGLCGRCAEAVAGCARGAPGVR